MDRVPDADGNESVVMPKRHNLLHFPTGTPRNEANRIKSDLFVLHFVRGSRTFPARRPPDGTGTVQAEPAPEVRSLP